MKYKPRPRRHTSLAPKMWPCVPFIGRSPSIVHLGSFTVDVVGHKLTAYLQEQGLLLGWKIVRL